MASKKQQTTPNFKSRHFSYEREVEKHTLTENSPLSRYKWVKCNTSLGTAPSLVWMSLTYGFTAPPWTQQTHPSVDDIIFLDFFPYYILKTMFIYCIHYETTDILVWVANNTNTAKTLMFPSMCIKQSCVCTTASRIVHEHARTNTRFLSWLG